MASRCIVVPKLNRPAEPAVTHVQVSDPSPNKPAEPVLVKVSSSAPNKPAEPVETDPSHLLLNDLKATWVEVEKKLKAKINPPRSVWVAYRDKETIYPGQPDEFERHHFLGIIRHRGEWRLCIGQQEVRIHGTLKSPFDDSPCEWKPITECSFEERIAAVRGVSKLASAIENSKNALNERVKGAIHDLKGALADL